ncbi:hypothetical protein [Arundinibacter roseus]|uniref:C2H2-type domain-containing protein n=1 Tax=Arundinibacter roseus TaxID=2070510 RepID=A0A4R4KJJ9_9BACT|nr:hypothetical protein [Arundinibacter roseus]TDB67092.1 hypothetical protein EZE20_08235 [Arundinibacter roseus]
MHLISYYKEKLENHYERMLECEGDMIQEYQHLMAIARLCRKLMLAPNSWLIQKAEERRGNHMKVEKKVQSNDMRTVQKDTQHIIPQFSCPDCGKSFSSKQARGAHVRFCGKGGSHE